MKFEDALKRLETVVERLDKGDLSLDASLRAFEEGVKLCRFLNAKLEEAEGKVEILLKDEKGDTVAVPFETGIEDVEGKNGNERAEGAPGRKPGGISGGPETGD